MKKTSMILRAVAYALLGAYIIIQGEKAVGNLHTVIGMVILIESLEEFIYELIKKSYKENDHSLTHPFAFMILAVIMLFMGEDSLGYLCIMWGTVAIIDSARELNEAVFEKAKGIHALKFLRSIVAIVFAILLVTDPFNHVRFHMILLAIEYILESVLLFDRIAEDRCEDEF